MKQLFASSLNDLNAVAESVLNDFPNERIFCFYGDLGVGKTTLIQFLCKNLGVNDVVTSPTFSLINHYKGGNSSDIYHFDFYRINFEQEALDIGIEEYLYSGNYCFIEWAEKISNIVPDNGVRVNIKVIENKRIIEF